MPVTDATVMVTDAPVPIHDIAAMTDDNGYVNLADYSAPGAYSVIISHNGENENFSFDLHTGDEVLTVAV